MRFAKWTFAAAAIYGFIVLTPVLFIEPLMARTGPALTYPEYFYGFTGVALVFQLVFVLISRDPVRLRPIMIPAVLEKLSWGIVAWTLFLQGRDHAPVVAFATVDVLWGLLFALAYLRTPTA